MVQKNNPENKSISNKEPIYEIKEPPILKKILNKILGPIQFF